MAIDFSSMKKVNEGKTKIIYENPEDPKTVYMVFKDDITAGDGAKHDIIEGKALIDWQTNRDIYEYLNKRGIQTHYISSPEEKVSLVKRLDRKINLEVVSRRVAAGSILKWGDVEEGTRYDPVITQFHYKDDPLHDPMLDQSYIDFIIREKSGTEYAKMMEMNAEAFVVLEEAFANFDVQLVDIKLEYGIIEGKVYIIDEVSGGSFRLWPYAMKNHDFNKNNVLSELDPEGRLDKDTYRMGGDIGMVKSKFGEIAKITGKFKDL
jgi:phosphoribosylaminoimidazole-succinocarboxamide synthase